MGTPCQGAGAGTIDKAGSAGGDSESASSDDEEEDEDRDDGCVGWCAEPVHGLPVWVTNGTPLRAIVAGLSSCVPHLVSVAHVGHWTGGT